MAKIYYNRVRAGKWRLEDVPARWRDDVAAMLAEDSSAGRGDGE